MKSFVYLFLSVVLFAQTAFAQEKYRAVRWGMNEGLSVETNNVMLKDVNGFLWIGSMHGLDRFDGNNFKNYSPDKNKPGTIIGTSITGLIEDSLHNIWIGTEKGLSRYDIKADTFRNFVLPANAVNRDIVPIWATRDEVYCMETTSTITAYNIHSFTKKILVGLTTEYAGGGRLIPPVFDAKSNSIWMLEGVFAQPGGGLFQVSLTDGKKNHYTWPCFKNISDHSHLSNDMCYDRKRNSIWISSPDGLIEITLGDKQFHRADGLNEIADVNDFTNPGGVSLDLQGRVWWNSAPKGIIMYDPPAKSFVSLFTNPRRQQASAFPCYHLYCDREGMVWASGWYTPIGIYQVIPASIPVFRYSDDTSQVHLLSSDGINNVIKADNEKLWIGQGDKLSIFDPQTGFFQLFCSGKDLPPFEGMPTTHSTPIQVDTIHQKALFTITNDQPGIGLIQMDIPTKQCRPVIFKDSAGQVMPDPPKDYNIIPYKNDAILVSDNGNGIFMVNTESGLAHWIAPGVKRSSGLRTDNDHLIFIRKAVTNLTYSFLDGKWKRIATPLDSIAWVGGAIYYNGKDKTYWAGDFNQLIHYDKDFRIIYRYTREDGLSAEDISNILSDDQDNIWIQTIKSISKLNIKTGKIILLAEKDGLRKQSYGPNTPVKASGDLYFWGENGIDRISPDKLADNYPSSFVYLKSIEINQKSFPLPTGINDLQELSLRYFQNEITIETGIIDYYTKGNSHIRYKLEGVNENWQVAPANYTIRYDGLPPSKYKLVIQASNAANEFNGPEKILFINISPAFWNTWWFRTMSVIIIIILIYAFMRWRIQQKFRLQLQQSEKERQLAELKQKSTELEMQALRAQMNPHFIFNSLNSINRFILQNNRTQASEYLTKFSKLVRMILQNSQASLISLESELESLGLYLEMEALRFNYHFDYKISVPKDLDIEILKVPPLIIQPYVENAIWHGLMHKEEKGQLNIDISEEKGHLYFKITDNGIGRKKASELASKSATKHKSMGLRITAHRIAIMQNSNGMESPVKINDLAEPDGTAAGTEVIIKMPVIE